VIDARVVKNASAEVFDRFELCNERYTA